MPRRPSASAELVATPAPHIVEAAAVYSLAAAAKALGLRKNSLPREIRAGRLQVSRRCGRYFIVGKWLLEWLERGKVRRKQPVETNGHVEDVNTTTDAPVWQMARRSPNFLPWHYISKEHL
jgi:hypothetical protein